MRSIALFIAFFKTCYIDIRNNSISRIFLKTILKASKITFAYYLYISYINLRAFYSLSLMLYLSNNINQIDA